MFFLRSMVQIPRLSEDLSAFFATLRTISESKEQHAQEDYAIQTFDPAQSDELISVAGDESVADSSMAYIQQEYRYVEVELRLEAMPEHKSSSITANKIHSRTCIHSKSN